MEFQNKLFKDLTSLEIYHILKIRQDIFICEQKVIYQDIDEKDLYSTHLWLARENSHDLLSYLRLVPDEDKNEVSIGRVLTPQAVRGRGYARQLLKYAIKFALSTYSDRSLKLHAQSYLCKFYSSLGFVENGPIVYCQDGHIAHTPMIYKG